MSRLTNARSGIERWQRERDLASDDRAGVFAHAKARSRLLRVARRAGWRLAASGAAVLLVCLPPLYFVPPGLRWFLAGVIVTSVGWFLWWIVVLMSGTAHTLAGELAEQWTAAELRRLHRRGWKTINGLKLREFDIDHVAIGPGGILVVETKWSAEPWRLDANGTGSRLAVTVKRLRRSALDVAGVLRPTVSVVPQPILILWGPEYQELPEHRWRTEVEGVQLITQPAVDRWREALPVDGLAPMDVQKAWRILDGYVRARERSGFHAKRPPGLADRFIDLWMALMGLLVGAFVAAVSWRPLGGGLVFVAFSVAAGALLAALRMLRPVRTFATAALLGLELLVVMLIAWTVADALL